MNKKQVLEPKKTARKGDTHTCRLASSAGGVYVAPRQKKMIRHQGEQGSEKKSE